MSTPPSETAEPEAAELSPAPEPAADPSPAPEPAADPSPAPLPPRSGWRIVSIIPHDCKEPPASLTDDLAQATWAAVSAPWHPSLLSRSAAIPQIESLDNPINPGPREIRIVPAGLLGRLPSGYVTQVEDAGSVLLESGPDRASLVARMQERLGAVGTPETSDDPGMIAAADDFLALGTTRWLVRDLASAMGHEAAIQEDALAREVLAGADAWQTCDRPTAVNRLRAAFEVLTQAREKFYPVDAYIVDLCLLDADLAAGALGGPLEAHVAISFIASARAIEAQAGRDPEGLARLRAAIDEGWVDVAGGTYAEAEDILLPLESVLWQFRRGAEVYRAHLDDRSVETYARRRFGLYSQVPQFAKRFGLRYAIHLGLDAGKFPVYAEPKRLWEGPDGSQLESLLRPPLAADRPVQGVLLPWRLAATMRNDHVATLPLAHWPAPVASWYADLRRSAGYSPVLGRWVTLNDYFHLTDRPYESLRPDPDSYVAPYLVQAIARRDRSPLSRLARHHRLRAGLDAAEWLRAMALAIAGGHGSTVAAGDPSAGPEPSNAAVESALETGDHATAAAGIETLQDAWAGRLARAIGGTKAEDAAADAARPGFLVLNPAGVPRRVAVLLPGASADLQPGGPLRGVQAIDEGVAAVVDLPAFGFSWIAATNPDEPAPPPSDLSAGGRILKNESMEVEIDEATGGIRGVMAVGESTARLGQQLVLNGLGMVDGKPVLSQMKGESFQVDHGGPALVQATAKGSIVDPRTGLRLAGFTQRFRLWTGRPMLELDVTIHDIHRTAIDRMQGEAARREPWKYALCCRWAWPDPGSMLRRTLFGAPEITEVEQVDTPGAFDVSTRHQRTALVFGGLPHHRRQGGRMLDTLLVAGMEEERTFRLGIALDLEYPFQAAMDMLTCARVVPAVSGPPPQGPRGWLIAVDQKSVAVTHVSFAESTGEDRPWGLVVHLMETAGNSSRCRVRFFRNPTWARQVDFQGDLVIDLSVDGDGILVDLSPNELARVEVTLG
ncbi:glycosyl hydrolase family 38 [Aquisphaera insulae]|uniref:glycoside hydrolase family 38 N-terminal domain-containing protein n=1 Tax=Aquisphaera insulae TaxID=2712864 RepID=UPI0013EAC94C|nr:glycosyl hydrolase family 38 [Aquisphaera insulae]